MYPFQVNDGEEMRAAIECGRLSEKVDSAYCVGCVIVHKPSKQVVSSGFSRELPGNTHAEECALMKLESSMKDLGIEGKIHELTLYTTMEPCSRRLSGKKSCTERIIEFGISRVEFGILEPKIFVQCQGSDILKAKGIEILQTQDISLQRDCSLLNSHLLQIQPDLFSSESEGKLRKEFLESKPYPHSIIDAVFNPELLRAVRKEVLEELHATYKETDIYKVRQTGDLANLDGLEESEKSKLSNLLHLRNALYSEHFRDFVQKITGSGPLSSTKFDLSTNIYSDGGHLLCHDDVIGTRRVSYIIYLPDPEVSWDPKSGGSLELYDCAKDGYPESIPCKLLSPIWNRLIMFTVLPGRSFHSVQEVIDKSRVSISGWFHADETVKDSNSEEMPASLEHLEKGLDSIENPFRPYQQIGSEEADEVELSEDDLIYLSNWINPRYLEVDCLEQIAKALLEQGSLQLANFLCQKKAKNIFEACKLADSRDGFLNLKGVNSDYGKGVTRGWTLVGPPHIRRYTELSGIDENPESSLLAELQSQLFESEQFSKLLSAMSSIGISSRRGSVRRFRPGSDYTLATAGKASVCIDATWTMITASPDVWSSDNVGGYMCLMNPDEKNADAAVYRKADDDEESNVISVSAGTNVLNLVIRPADMIKFVKYVSCKAPGSRWEVNYEYMVEELGEEQEEDEEEEEGADDVNMNA